MQDKIQITTGFYGKRNAQLRKEIRDRHDGICFYCGIKTTEPYNNADLRSGTLDHVHSKLSNPTLYHKNSPLCVWSCLRCNLKRGAQENKALGIEELRRRSSFPPRKTRKKEHKLYLTTNNPLVALSLEELLVIEEKILKSKREKGRKNLVIVRKVLAERLEQTTGETIDHTIR